MGERVREERRMIENQNEEQDLNGVDQPERATDALVQSNSTLRNNSNQPNPRSSSLTPLSSNSPSPRRRPTPRNVSPPQQYSTRMSNSPRSNSIYEESPDTTLSSTAFGTMGDHRSIRKERLRSGNEEIELDYGESGDEMEVETEKPKVDDISEVQHAQEEADEARRPDSSHLRQSPSTYIAPPWYRRRSISSPRPRSPSPASVHHFAPSPSAPPHTASLSPNVSRSIPPPRLIPISLPAPEMIRLHLCLPRDLPDASLSYYFNTISPPFEIYEQTLATSQPAAMGFIIVEKNLWDNGEIEARVKRRGDMQFGFGGKRTWSIKLTVAKDQLFSTKRLYEQALERRAERERERRAEGWVGMILEGFGKGTEESFVQGILSRFLWFWEDLRVEDVGEGVRVTFEVKGQKAARVVEKDFEGALIEGRRIRVGRVERSFEMRDRRYAETEDIEEIGRGRRETSEVRMRSRSRSRSRRQNYRDSPNRNESTLNRSGYKDRMEDGFSSEARRRREPTRGEIVHRRNSRSRSPRGGSRRSPSLSSSHHFRYRSRSPELHSRQSRSDRYFSHSRQQSSQYESQGIHSRRYSQSRSPRRQHSFSTSRRIHDSPPHYASPDPQTRSDPSHWRQDTPIHRSSPASNRVPLPRPPTSTQPRAFEDRKRDRRFAGSALSQDRQRWRRDEEWQSDSRGRYE